MIAPRRRPSYRGAQTDVIMIRCRRRAGPYRGTRHHGAARPLRPDVLPTRRSDLDALSERGRIPATRPGTSADRIFVSTIAVVIAADQPAAASPPSSQRAVLQPVAPARRGRGPATTPGAEAEADAAGRDRYPSGPPPCSGADPVTAVSGAGATASGAFDATCCAAEAFRQPC